MILSSTSVEMMQNIIYIRIMLHANMLYTDRGLYEKSVTETQCV